MRRATLGLILLVTFSLPGFAQETDESSDGGVYGYTSLSFDEGSGQVTAYSETEIDPDLETYYLPTLGFSVYDQNNHFITGSWQPGCTKYYDGETFSWTCQFTGAWDATYTASGYHGVELQQQYECDPEYGACQFLDYLYFSDLEGFGIVDLGAADFFGPGPSTGIDYNDVDVGSTYDSAWITIPGPCNDVRDLLIQEYYSLSTYKPTSCNDFVNEATWDYYYVQLVPSYFNYGDLTKDQTTGYGLFAVLQPYAYVNGLNAIGNVVLSQSAPYGITSAYRNPAAEITAAQRNGVTPAQNSRHESGDGADLQTNWGGVSIFGQIYNAAAAANTGACFEPGPFEKFSHVHVDWRTQTGPNNNWGGTNDWPNPTAGSTNHGCPSTGGGWLYQ